MSDRVLRTILVALSLAGACVAAYLLVARWTSTGLLCSTGGCETVQSSEYAELLGVPVAGLGIVGYLVIAAAALGRGALSRATAAAVALGAVGFGGYLLVIQLVVIGAVCDWCLVTDAITSLVAAVAVVRLLRADDDGILRTRTS
jgi:uncharacterized membrane protein